MDKRLVTGAKGRSKRAEKAAAAAAQLAGAREKKRAAEDEASAARAAAIAPPPELMVDGPRLWLTNCDGPGAQPARNAAHDEFDALHLL